MKAQHDITRHMVGESFPAAAAGAIPTVSGERRLRLALVIASLGGGGAESYACTLARSWSDLGHEITLVTIHGPQLDVLAPPPGVRRVALAMGGQSRHVLAGFVKAIRRVLAARRSLLEQRPDVVVSFLEQTNIVTILSMMRTGVPVFVCERSDPRHDPITRHWALLRHLVYPRATGVIVQTESVAEWARDFCPRVHVIPNFVERPGLVAAPGTDGGPRTLIALGRLHPAKGFDLLIEAFSRIAPSHPRWTLEILGEGPERARLESLVASHGLQDHVSLPGRATDPLAKLAAAHAFALSSRYEGFPNALLEAMACGLPAVAFDCQSGPSEIITHERDGLLVKSGDVAALAAALDRVMGNAAERVRLGNEARRVAERLSPERVLAMWSNLLQPAGVR